MPTVSVDLPEQLTDFVDHMVAEGPFRNASEVMREAMRRLEAEEDEWEKVKAGVMLGLAQIERGEVIDGEEAFKRLREKYFNRA
jgi:antitoxin ParD1/3/4